MKKRVVVMSGISGSGKSTTAKTIHDANYAEYEEEQKVKYTLEGYNSYTVSADHFFMKDGVYAYDAAKISEAHATCFRKFIEHLSAGGLNHANLIVVDNTNCSAIEIAPYIAGANAFDFDAEIITIRIDNEDPSAAHKCFKRNKHGVPFATICRMNDTLTRRHLPPWWKNTDVPATF